jgi:two-component system OmpR family response regulator
MMHHPEAGDQAQGRLVYVVEDDDEIARLVRSALHKHGFHTEHFRTGRSFLQSLQRKAPAISVIDLGLPDLDGMHLVRQVQAISDSPVLILTGRQSVDDRILGLELGADDYMVKPFEPREVVARVNTILRRLERRAVRRMDIRGGQQPPDRTRGPRGRAVGRRGSPPCDPAQATQSHRRSLRAVGR